VDDLAAGEPLLARIAEELAALYRKPASDYDVAAGRGR
jgi:hypothetical protein